MITDPDVLTPVEWRDGIMVKRDDLFGVGNVRGGKIRTCLAIANKAKQKNSGLAGLVTAGSRSSPQVNIVAAVAQWLKVKCVVHVPSGELGPEVKLAASKGAEVVQHSAGYNTVIVKRARDCAAVLHYTEIPFGMECEEAVTQSRRQVANISWKVKRIVVPVGSGMTVSGILWGLLDQDRKDVKVVGVRVGADPTDRLCNYAPMTWQNTLTLVKSGVDYQKKVNGKLDGIVLDPIYEAKCLPHVRAGDLFWIVGVRESIMGT